MALVFVPVSTADRSGVAAGHPLGQRRAHAVTPELMAALEYGPEALEDAEYAAMVLASVTGLSQFGERVVLVADLDEAAVHPAADAANGEVVVDEVSPSQVQSFFPRRPGGRRGGGRVRPPGAGHR